MEGHRRQKCEPHLKPSVTGTVHWDTKEKAQHTLALLPGTGQKLGVARHRYVVIWDETRLSGELSLCSFSLCEHCVVASSS